MSKILNTHIKPHIRIDCYLAVLKKFKEQYPNAHFEIITRTAHSILSPSWELLKKSKEEEWNFEYYSNELLKEFKRIPAVWKKIEELQKIAKTKDIFLVCYEKDASKCHRSIIKTIMEKFNE